MAPVEDSRHAVHHCCAGPGPLKGPGPNQALNKQRITNEYRSYYTLQYTTITAPVFFGITLFEFNLS